LETELTVYEDYTIGITWEKSGEFGNIYITNHEFSKQITIDSEYMNKEFVKLVLCNLIDNAKFVDK